MTEISTNSVFDALRTPLTLIDNEERRRTVEAYLDAARPQLERAVFDLMSQLVQAIDERTEEHYRARLTYRPGGLALEVEEKVREGDETRWSALEGDVEKITIRIPAELKELATQAAARSGTSANTWFIKALARAVRSIDQRAAEPPDWREEPRNRRGSRLQGWIGGTDD